MSNKVFVGGLSFNTTENDLQEAFAAHGGVNEVNVITDRATGKSKGFAFVTMNSPQEAQTAISAMDGHVLDGRNLTVNEARPREQRGSGGRDGSAGGYQGNGGGYNGGGQSERY